jgi:hypothetical protein
MTSPAPTDTPDQDATDATEATGPAGAPADTEVIPALLLIQQLNRVGIDFHLTEDHHRNPGRHVLTLDDVAVMQLAERLACSDLGTSIKKFGTQFSAWAATLRDNAAKAKEAEAQEAVAMAASARSRYRAPGTVRSRLWQENRNAALQRYVETGVSIDALVEAADHATDADQSATFDHLAVPDQALWRANRDAAIAEAEKSGTPLPGLLHTADRATQTGLAADFTHPPVSVRILTDEQEQQEKYGLRPVGETREACCSTMTLTPLDAQGKPTGEAAHRIDGPINVTMKLAKDTTPATPTKAVATTEVVTMTVEELATAMETMTATGPQDSTGCCRDQPDPEAPADQA